MIKKIKEYEFTLSETEDLHFIFKVITEEAMKNIIPIYQSLDFFLIFVDIQSTSALKCLEKYIDSKIKDLEKKQKEQENKIKEQTNIIEKKESTIKEIERKKKEYNPKFKYTYYSSS